jgi:hypothetical protein
VAQLTEGRIGQLKDGIIDVSTTITTDYESGGDDYQLKETDDDDKEDDRDVETDSEQTEEWPDVSDCGVTEQWRHDGAIVAEVAEVDKARQSDVMQCGVKEELESEIILDDISDVMIISPEEVVELWEDSMNDSCMDFGLKEKPSDRKFHPAMNGSCWSGTRQRSKQDLEEPPLERFNEKNITTKVADIRTKVPGMVPRDPVFSTLHPTSGYAIVDEYKSLILGCNIRESREECHRSFDANGVLRNQSELRTAIHTALNVTHRSNRKITLNPRVCYRKDGTTVDLTQTAAFETLVRLTRQLEQNDSDGPTEVSDLPWVPGICDEPGDPFYEPVSIPKNVLEAVDEFIESCVTAIREGDPNRVWTPPTDSAVATYMSIVLTTPLYTWAIGPTGGRIKVLLDSGSAISLIPDIKGIESSSEFCLDKSAPSITVRGVDPGSCLRSGGIVSFPLKFPVQEFEDGEQNGSKDSRSAYTIQRGPIEVSKGKEKVRMTPVDDSRTHVHFKFTGFHIEKAGCGTLIGMDLLAGDSLGGNWATPMGFDFKNGRVLFSAPPLPMQSETRVARVPTFYSTPQKETSSDSPTVLVVVYHEIHIPPGQTVQARCVAQCGPMPKKGVCTIDAFSGLPMVKDERNGYTDRAIVGRQYVMSRYVPDPNLFVTEEVVEYEREVVREGDKSFICEDKRCR